MSGPAPRTPGAYGMSLRARLRNLAAASGRPAGDLHREHLLQRFLSRVFADPHSGWIFKGGTGLLARLPGARHSEDIDLLHPALDLTDAVAQLREVASSAGGDPYRFVVDAVQPMVGGVEGAQVRVTAYLGAQKTGDFRIDLATAVTLTAAVERRAVAPILTDPDVGELPEFVLYPLADQVADKVCAMYERHGPDQLPSSRYRDLVDLALIVGNFDLDAAELAAALAQESGRRGLRLPSAITSPGPVWARQFPRPPAGRCCRRDSSSWRPPSPRSDGAWTRCWPASAARAGGGRRRPIGWRTSPRARLTRLPRPSRTMLGSDLRSVSRAFNRFRVCAVPRLSERAATNRASSDHDGVLAGASTCAVTAVRPMG